MVGSSLRRFTSCILLSVVFSVRALFAADIPAPIAPDNPDIAGFVTLPDFKRAITTLEGIIKQVAPPNEFKEGMIAAQIGQQIGDPTLAVLGNKPIMMVVFKAANFTPDNPPPIAFFVPVNETPVLAQLQEGMKNDPKVKFAYEDGTMIVAMTDEFLAKAKAAKGLYSKITDAKLQNDARVYINLASLIETFGAPAKAELNTARDKAIADITQHPPPPELGFSGERAIQVVKLFFKVINGLMDQAAAVQLDLQIKPDAIQIEHVFAARSGSMLADYLSGNPPPADPRLQSFLTNGFELVYSHTDQQATAAFVKKAIAAIAADPEIAPLAETEFVKSIAASVDADGNEGVFSLGASPEGGLQLSGAGIVKDEAAYRASMEKATAMLKNEPIFNMILNKTGVTVDVNNNARQHGGVNIQRFNITVNPPNTPPEALTMIKKIVPQPEIAVSKGFFLMSSNPATLDAMLDKVANGDFSPSPVGLKSVAAFGKDKNFYLDYDVTSYMKFVMSMVPDPNAARIMANFKANAPLLVAGATGNGRSMTQIQIPLAPILEGFKTYMMLQGAMPPPKPPDDAEKKQF